VTDAETDIRIYLTSMMVLVAGGLHPMTARAIVQVLGKPGKDGRVPVLVIEADPRSELRSGAMIEVPADRLQTRAELEAERDRKKA